MKCKTRGNSSPQGKARVYFSCHQADFSELFEEISDVVLKNYNCAVYYEELYDNDVNCSELNEMQLIVMPITSNFLFSVNRAKDVVLPYAKQSHIPILPLIQEVGMESEFNRLCGDIQCISRYAKNLFCEDYEERIVKHISRILITDEMANIVRRAFEAYIFISYRKVDHEYAQKLIKLIHENDFCRDVAVWYDEFLIPGENFNSAIRKAIEQCELFAMVITPNIVDNNNYVMNVEYPVAKDIGKTIIPVEMVKTDNDSLKQSYDGILNPTDGYCKEALSEILKSSLKDVVYAERNSEPKHLFFIGLAYLKGIDVEVDYDRAIELIERAANSGLEIAMHRLAVMYNLGECVEVNHEKSIYWYEKLVSHIDTKCIDEIDWTEFVQILWELGAVYNKEGAYANSKKIYERVLRACLSDVLMDTRIRYQYKIIAMNCLGSMAYADKNYGKAVEYYDSALFFCCEAEKQSILDCRYYRTVSYTNIGIIQEEYVGNLDKALDYYRRCLNMRKELVNEDRSMKNVSDLSLSYRNMAFVFRQKKEVERALYCWKQVYILEKELVGLAKGLYEKQIYTEKMKETACVITRLSKSIK